MEFRILIHTYDPQLFMLLQHILATEGFAASLAGRPDEIPSELRETCAQALIVDSSQPLNPDDLAGLRTGAHHPSIVLLTQQPAEAVDPVAEALGPDLVLPRPFDPALLERRTF
jgi:two-component system, OmpR family, phosphate regulon response regulator PhoB